MAKVLTIKQPWAQLIADGIKDVENRTWQTHYRGRILIHAAGTPQLLRLNQLLTKAQKKAVEQRGKIVDYLCHKWQNGAIIGSVEVYDVVKNDESIWAEAGPYNWLLRNPILYTNALPVKGKLGLWEIDDELVKDLGV